MFREIIMNNKKYIVFCLMVSLLLIRPATAAENQEKKKAKPYSSSTSFSALLTTGNNKDFTISFDTDQNLKFKKDSFNLRANVIYAESNKIKKSEIYATSLKYNRQFNKKAYLLGMTQYSRNVLSGYNSRIAISAGTGYTWLQKPKIGASSELAFGWSSEKNAEIITQKITGGQSSPIRRAARASFITSILSTKLNFTLSPNTQLSHTEVLFLNLEDLSGYRINSKSALSTAINKYFGLKTSIHVSYENKPVLGHKNTDLFILSSLVIKI